MAVTLSDIHATQIYKNLLLIGCKDLGAATRSRRPELKINIEHESLGTFTPIHGGGIKGSTIIGNYILFQTGYIRLFTDGPHQVSASFGNRKDYVMNLTEWKMQLQNIFDNILRKIVLEVMGLSNSTYGYSLKNKKTVASKFSYLVMHNPNAFFKWLNKIEDATTSESIIDLIAKPITAMINANAGQWVFILKELYKNPAVARILENLDPEASKEFRGDVGLIGDLHDLGVSYQPQT